VLTEEQQHEELSARRSQADSLVPSYPALEKSGKEPKVSAAWLVEKSGFARGYGFGHVGISSKHALAIVNRGGATAAEVLALKDQIQHRVEEIWGVRLEPEPVMVGFCCVVRIRPERNRFCFLCQISHAKQRQLEERRTNVGRPTTRPQVTSLPVVLPQKFLNKTGSTDGLYE
jgi:hypothetical protein